VNSSILEDLNPQQREAVVSTEGPVLVIAGAGSGKTRVIAHRMAYLIRERSVPSWQILAATFTNKAAREMRDRVYALLELDAQVRLSISTFHSFCAKVLRREAEKASLPPRFTILDENDQRAVVKACMKRLEIDPKSLTAEQAVDRIGQAKTRLLDPGEAHDLFAGGRAEEYLAIYREYERMLAANAAVDFDDLLLKIVRLFERDGQTLAHYQDRFRYLLVDEYQDTNLAQFRLIQLLAGKSGNLCVVGDEDQSIYSWRGAEISNLLDFPKAFANARVIRLEQNYRSTKTILAVADTIIRRNTERLGKTLWTAGPDGEPVVVVSTSSAQGEAAFVVEQIQKLRLAEGVPLRETAVFYRINALSRSVEDRLRAENTPYRVIGGIRFYDRQEIKDALAYLQAVASPASSLALGRIINRPRRGIGDKTLRTLEGFALERGVALSQAIQDEEALASVPRKARGALAALSAMIEKWRKEAERIPLKRLTEQILEDTGYIESLGDEDSLEAVTRSENLAELLASIGEYEQSADSPCLLDYLEQVALATSADEGEAGEDAVSLMTLHSAKGLEFRVVFMIGLEEAIFPSPRATMARGNIEEERRLFYVGVTRAKQRLYISWARSRWLHGRTDWTTPSVFLHELPQDLCQTIEQADEAMASEILARSSRSDGRGGRTPGRGGLASHLPRRRQKRSLPPAPKLFAVGQRVEHVFLGRGEIIDIEGQGEMRRLIIRFDDGQVGEILERYGDLRNL